MSMGTKNQFIIYDQRTGRLSKFAKTSSAYNRISRTDPVSGLRFTKITNKVTNNIQFPMVTRGGRYRKS